MDENNNKKSTEKSSLTGAKRAVPIVLVALAAFIGLCFITQNTGYFGRGISSVILGLFSIGGYFIPLILLIHALFYPSDLQRGRIISRIIFSVITIITIAATAHCITYFGQEQTFSPTTYYTDGIASIGGGFIGGVIAFGLAKIFGSVGLLIIALVIFALYITFFFAGGRSSVSKVLLAILNFVSDLFTVISKKSKERKKRMLEKKEERRIEELAAAQEELAADDFFEADNGMSELSISELGIKETRDEAELERNPSLQNKVFHKSAISEEEYIKNQEKKKDFFDGYGNAYNPKKVSMDYSETPFGLSDTVEPLNFERRPDDIIYDEPSDDLKAEKALYGLDENADDVFTKDFDAFDFKINQEIAARPSSKGIKEETFEFEGINQFAEPLVNLADEEIEKARQRADFEMKKKAAIEARKKMDAELNKVGKALGDNTVRSSATLSNAPVSISFESDEKLTEEPFVEEEKKDYLEEMSFEFGTPQEEPPISYDTTPYTYSEHLNTTPVEIPIYQDNSTATPIFEEPVIQLENTTEETTSNFDFKPYELHVEEPIVFNRTTEDESIKISRSMLDPTPTLTESLPEEKTEPTISLDMGALEFEFESGEEPKEETVLIFDNENEKDISAPEEISVIPEEDEEDLFPAYKEAEKLEAPEEDIPDEGVTEEDIPEELQNEQVKEYRKMFPCIEEEDDGDNDFDETGSESADNFFSDAINEGEQTIEEVIDEEPESDEIDETDEIDDGYTETETQQDVIKEEDTSDDEPPFEYAPPQNSIKPIIPPKAPEAPKPQEKTADIKPDYSDYQHPPVDLLTPGKNEEDPKHKEEIAQNADKLIDTLAQFNVKASIKGVDHGPRITRYEIVPARGVKVTSITNLFDDIALNLAAEGIRMEAPIPGKSAIGVEIPNKHPSFVLLRDLVETEEFEMAKEKTTACLGKDVTGNPIFCDIAKMPHMLVAGATGMGKSVCINSILISILYKARPDEVKFIMIDPKQVEFNGYNGIPHLLVPVVTDVKQAAGALMWAVEQMEKRYDLMKNLEVKNIDTYNEKVRLDPTLGEPLPKIIIVIDELNDIMLQVKKPAEDLIMSIAQKARAAGIHLIIGTQRPSVDVITGVIKANIPSRIACKVSSYNDSKTILEQAGAEKLLKNGDMLYFPAGAPKPLRVQGAFVSETEVVNIMKFLKSQAKGNVYDAQALEEINNAAKKCSKGKGDDDFDDDDDDGSESVGILNDQQFLDAVDIAIKQGKISTSLIQRKISIGYGKAAKFIDHMEEMGLVSEPNGQRPRDVLITKDEWHEMLSRRSLD